MTKTIDAARQYCAGTPPTVWGDGTPAPRNGGRQAYAMHFRGELLVVSRDPKFDACRRLLADGFAGQLVTRWAGAAYVALPLTIEQGALLATFDGRTAVRIGKWRPFETSGDVDKPHAQLPLCGLTLQRALWLAATSCTKTAARFPR